jgi:hypothetical protein
MPLKNPPISPSDKKKKTKKEEIEKKDNNPDKIVDSKEEFFRLMAKKIKEDPSEEKDSNLKKKSKSKHSLKNKSSQYKKIVLRFSFLVLVLLLAVFYFSFVSLNIVVYADKENVKEDIVFYAYSEDSKPNLERAVPASIDNLELSSKETFTSTGEKKLGGEIIGKVTIINEYSKSQPLVATTRLLSSDDKLFRIKDTVNVPAGGSVEAEIYADEVSEDMAIAPDKFIIPGLWSGLQDKIYAESYESFTLNQDVEKYILQDDFSRAVKNLNDNILEQAESILSSSVKEDQLSIIDIDESSIEIKSEQGVGDEAEVFEVELKSFVNIVIFNKDDLLDVIEKRLDILDFNMDFSKVNLNSFEHSLINLNSDKDLAEIKTEFLVETSLGGPDKQINKSHLTNLNEDQIKAYLRNIEEIKSYELFFKPDFIKRSSLLVDKINIEYK